MVHILAKQVFRDFDEWLRGFTENAPLRREYGSEGAVVFRDPGNDREVMIYFKWDSVENFKKFLRDPRLDEKIESVEAGVPLLITESYEVEA